VKYFSNSDESIMLLPHHLELGKASVGELGELWAEYTCFSKRLYSENVSGQVVHLNTRLAGFSVLKWSLAT